MSVAASALGGFALLRARFATYGTLALALAAVAFLAVPTWPAGVPLTAARGLVGLGLVALAFGLPASLRDGDRELRAALPRIILGAAVLLAAGLATDLGPAAFVLPAVIVAVLLTRSWLLDWMDGRLMSARGFRFPDSALSAALLALATVAAMVLELSYRGSLALSAPVLILGLAYVECVRAARTRPLHARGEAVPAG